MIGSTCSVCHACLPAACVCCCRVMVASRLIAMRGSWNSPRCHCCCCVNSSSALLKVVQLRLPDVEKTYLDLVLQHRARYKQRWVTRSATDPRRGVCQWFEGLKSPIGVQGQSPGKVSGGFCLPVAGDRLQIILQWCTLKECKLYSGNLAIQT